MRFPPGQAEDRDRTGGRYEHLNVILNAFRYHEGVFSRCVSDQVYILVAL